MEQDEIISQTKYKQMRRMSRIEFNEFARRLSKRGLERGIKLASIALFYALRKQYGFGNQRIERVFDMQASLLYDMWNGKIRVETLQKELVKDGIDCLKED